MITYSLCHASYKSEGNSIRVRNAWLNRARFPNRVHHLLGFERGDYQVAREYEIDAQLSLGQSSDGLTLFTTTVPRNSISAVENWNAAASLSKEYFLIAIADDLIPEENWDLSLDKIVEKNIGKPRVLTFTDDRCTAVQKYGNDTLLTRHPGMTREAYDKLGYLFPPEYQSVGSDLEVLIEALKKGWLLDARNIKLHHSYNRIFNQSGELLCGCGDIDADINRGKSQVLIHQESQSAKVLLEARWGKPWMRVATLACANRFAESVYASMKFDRENRAASLLIATLFREIYKWINRSLSKMWR